MNNPQCNKCTNEKLHSYHTTDYRTLGELLQYLYYMIVVRFTWQVAIFLRFIRRAI